MELVTVYHAEQTDPRLPKVFAHRGSSGLYAENTRAAFLHALAEGADGIETDVHLTADGHVVCFHDFTLERTTDGTGPLARRTLDELRRLDVHSWKRAALRPEYGDPAEQLVTLRELLEILSASGMEVELALELKHENPMRSHDRKLDDAVMAILGGAGWVEDSGELTALDGPGRVSVSVMSFSGRSLRYWNQVFPDLAADRLCALFSRKKQTLDLVKQGEVGLAGPKVSYALRKPKRLRKWAEAGVRSRVWTVDDPAQVAFLRELGVEGITTNYPEMVIRALRP